MVGEDESQVVKMTGTMSLRALRPPLPTTVNYQFARVTIAYLICHILPLIVTRELAQKYRLPAWASNSLIRTYHSCSALGLKPAAQLICQQTGTLKIHLSFYTVGSFYSLLILGLLTMPEIATTAPVERTRLGWREKVLISPQNFEMIGKLDTGADRTSIHAQNIVITGDKVSFETTNFRGDRLNIVRPLLSSTLIKRHGYKSQARPVITLGFCIGNKYIEGKVSLTDRSRYSTTLLLGRELLQHLAVVDPSVEMQVQPTCPTDTPKAHEARKGER
jgi:hypothetical protein